MFMCVNAHSPLMSQNNEKKANTEHGPMDGQRLAATQALGTVWWLERVGLRADPETGGGSLLTNPVGARSGKHPARGRSKYCHDQGDSKRISNECVEDQRGADHCTEQHGGNGNEPSGRLGPLTPSDMAVRGDARDRHGENGGSQIGHGEFARAGVLDPHRDGEDHNHGVSDSGGQRIGAECSEDNPRHKEHSLDRSGSAEQLTSVSGESRSHLPTDEGPDSEGGYAASDAAMENPEAPTSANPKSTTLPVMLATKT